MKFDRYKIVRREDGSPREICRSATTVSQAAQDQEFDVPVVLCRLRSEILEDEDLRQQFTHQVRAVASLCHPRVPAVYALEDSIEDCYFIHQHFEGEPLRKLVERQGVLPPEEALATALQVVEVLEAAHKHGLVYGNLTPWDVLQTDPGKFMVTSFDLLPCGEYCVAPSTRAPGAVEDPQFASPEHLEGKPMGVASSFYVLGALLWFMLTGRPPYQGSAGAVREMQQTLPPPFQELEHLPPEISRLLGRLLELDPERRPANPSQLKEALQAAKNAMARSEPPGPGSPLPPEPAVFPSGAVVSLPKMTAAREPAFERHPRQFALLEFLAGAMIAVAIYVFMQRPVSSIAPDRTPAAQASVTAPGQ